MPTLKSIKKRISATRSTKKLTRAMKMIAAAKLRKAQMRAVDARMFVKEGSRILAEIAKLGAEISHPLFKECAEKSNSIDLVIFTSDKGMCGTFNENLLRQATAFISGKKLAGISVNSYILGKKGRDYFKRNGLTYINEFTYATLGDEISSLIDRYTACATDKVVIAYNKLRGMNAEITFKTLIPSTVVTAENGYGIDYIYEPERKDVIDFLVESMIKSSFYQAYLESAAGELAARMVSMDKATKNADDLITALTTQFNRARQASITKELIDIIGGAEALK